MFKKASIVGFSVGCFFSGILAVVVGKGAWLSMPNLGGLLIVVFGVGSLIFGLSRKQ